MEQADMKLRRTQRTQSCALKSSGTNGESGFTLIETAIALAVMMVAGLAITSLFIYSINYNSGAGDRALALSLAQQRLERLRKTPWPDASLNTASTTETVVAVGHQFTVVTTVCSTSGCGGSDQLKILTVQVTPQAASGGWVNIPISVSAQRATTVPGPYLR
jgi:Tfp pilus assembly protein PilV